MTRYLLSFLFFLSCFSLGGGLYFLFCRDQSSHTVSSKCKVARKEDAFKNEHLHSIRKNCQQLCQKAFALQREFRLTEAKALFDTAFLLIEGHSHHREEIIGGKILNSFFSDDSDGLKKSVTSFEKTYPQSFFIDLFRALLCYKNEEYIESLRYLSSWKNCIFNDKTILLKEHIDELRSIGFLDFLEAEGNIRGKEFSLGRLSLYRMLDDLFNKKRVWNVKIYDQILLMLGQSFLKELDCSNSVKLQTECYKNILFYLEKTIESQPEDYEKFLPQEELFARFKDLIIDFDAEGIHTYIQLIRFWEKRYPSINKQLFTKPLLECFHSSYDSLLRFCSIFCSSGLERLKKEAVHVFEELLLENIRELSVDGVQCCLHVIKTIDPNKIIDEKFFLKEEEFEKLIVQDEAFFPQLQHYLHLLDTVQLSEDFQERLRKCLFVNIEHLWKLHGGEKKALQLLVIVEKFFPKSKESKDDLRLFIRRAYRSALANHDIDKLISLENFISSSCLEPIHIEEDVLANFLEDAKFLCLQEDVNLKSLYSEWLSMISGHIVFHPKIRKIVTWLMK